MTERWPIAAEPGRDRPLPRRTAASPSPTGRIRRSSTSAVDAGAVVLDHRRVTGIEPRRGSVRVSTDGDEITARACVVAAGAWGRALLGRRRDRACRSSRRARRSRTSASRMPLRLPPIIDDAVPDAEEHGLLRPGLINYALPAPGVGLKAGLHHAGPPADPDEPGSRRPGGRALGLDLGGATLSRARSGAARAPRPVSTRTRPTSRSCSSGTGGSLSHPPARATGSSSRPPSGARSPRSRATQPAEPEAQL